MNDFMDTAKDAFKKVPPIGWVAIVTGFVLVAWLSARGGRSRGTASLTPVPNYAPSGFEKASEGEQAAKYEKMIADRELKFAEGFQTQADNYMKELSEQQKIFKNQLDTYNGSFEERLNALTNSKHETNSSTKPQTGGGAVSSVGILQTGSFKEKGQAELLASHLTKTYGGQKVDVVQENGKWVAKAEFVDAARAAAVGKNLQDKGSLGVYHAK